MSKTYAAAHSGIQYFGNWVYDGTRRYTSIQYSRCIFTFTGNSVRVYFNTRPDGGMARIYVDGAYQATVNTENSENLKQMLFEKNGYIRRQNSRNHRGFRKGEGAPECRAGGLVL